MKRLQSLSYKTLFTILFFSLAGIVFFLKIGGKTTKVSAAWWDESWHYRIAVIITNNTGYDATNIPYKANLDTQTLISAGKLQSDADDIRVVDTNGNIVRSQVEKSTLNTTVTKVWFEANVKNGNSATYYIYYGNSTAPGPNFVSDIQSFSNNSTTSTINMKDGFSYTTATSNGGRVSDIRKDSSDIGVDGNINYSGSYPGNWWNAAAFTQTILNSTGPLFVEVVYSSGATGNYSTYESDVKVFDNGFGETRLFVTYNASGSEQFYYYLPFTNGTRNSVWVNGSGTLVDQAADSGTLYQADLGQNWFGQRWTSTGKYGGTIITKNGSDWYNGYTSAQASYFQTNYSTTLAFTSGTTREVRFGVFSGDGGLTEMAQKGANYGGLGSTLKDEEIGTAPIAYWKFDEGSGTTAYDSISSQNNGTFLSSPIWKNENECISGKCLAFDNVDDGVSITNKNFVGLTNYTMSAWINIKGTHKNYAGTIMSSGNWNTSQWVFGVNQTNTKIYLYGAGTQDYNFQLNKWTHVVVTRNGSQYTFYINGKNIGGYSGSSSPLVSDATNTTIGRETYAGGYFAFNGWIDEPKIYPYALTDTQVKNDYNSRGSTKGSSVNLGIKSNTAPSLKSGLVAYWKFDENNGTSVFDSSENNITGTFVGTTKPTWQTGKYKSGIGFSGVNDSISLPYQPDFRNAFSVSIWFIRTTDYNQTTDIMLLSPPNAWYFYDSYNSGAIRGDVYIDGVRRAGINVPIPFDGNWYHVVYTYDSVTHIAKMYKNGKIYQSVDLTSLGLSNYLIDSATGNLSNLGGNTNRRGIIIDEVKIYNKALTADEIKQDYNANSAIQFGSTNQTIGGTTTSLDYCIPGDTSYCVPPVAEWNFEENTGTTAKDTSGNGNDGTFGTGSSAPTWTVGQNNKGSGIKFDGTQQYINIPSSNSLNINNNQVTLSLWVKLNKLPSQIPGSYSGIYDAASDSYVMYLEKSTGDLKFKITDSDSTAERPSIPESQLTIDKWSHITGVYDGSNGTAKIYLNGQLVDTHTNVSLIDNVLSGQIGRIGDGGSSDRFFDGLIDQVKIYNYARTPAQIAYDYNRGSPIGWWKFDECQGSTVFDASGLGNTGAISIGLSGSQTSLGTCQTGTSAAWTNGATGKINSSLNFDGVDDYISIPNVSQLKFGLNNFSISTWIKGPPSQANFRYIIIKTGSSRYSIETFGNNWFWRLDDDQAHVAQTTVTKTILDNNWHMLTLVVDRTNQKAYSYTDGVLSTTPNNISSLIGDISPPNNLFLGGTSYFNGQIDDVRIYNYALTAEQIKTVYNNGAVNFQ